VKFVVGVPIWETPVDPAPVVPVVPVAVLVETLTPAVPYTLPKQLVPLGNGEIGAGLKPPLLSSVSPNGIPVGPTVEVDPRPSGDVIIAGPVGVVIIACAKLALQPIRIAIVDAMTSRMGASVQRPVCRADRIEHVF
jgi:hypothetical protein